MNTATVDHLGHKGDGIVRTDEGTLHVAKVLPGEVIRLEGTRLMAIDTPSPERVTPFCPHYDSCGGCKFQHWRERAYAAWKHSKVVEALEAEGLGHVSVLPMIDAAGEGRRRVSLHVRKIGEAWRAGFMELKSHTLAPLDSCPVLAPALQAAPQMAARFGSILGPCDVSLTLVSNGIDVAVRAERKAVVNRLAALTEVFNAFRFVRLSVNGEELLQREPPLVALGRAKVPLPPGSFVQATRAGEDILTRLVLGHAKGAKHVADLFSGVGTFALPLAEHSRVTAIDSDKPAIAALSAAVRGAQGMKPVKAEVRNLFKAPLQVDELKEFDLVVMDPPRAGAEAQVQSLARSAITAAIYVSCDAATFARDARVLTDVGYKLAEVQPVDQFKWSSHVELVAAFKR
jgi:23S rRNA (uracil1939-C5)-methyltransferase